MNALLIHLCDGAIVVAIITAAFCAAVWLTGALTPLREAKVDETPDEDHVITASLRVPEIVMPEGYVMEACELRAIELLFARQINQLAAAMHDEAMEHIRAQVAAHESKRLDVELEQLGGAA